MKYLAWDCEVSKWPNEGNDWKSIRPLGITCVGLMETGWDNPRLFYAGMFDEFPEPRAMNYDELHEVVNALETSSVVVGWNSLQFDFQVLAEEVHPNEVAFIKDLAMRHVDPLFYIFCSLGWPVGLQAVSTGLGLPGKLKPNDPGETTFGAQAPELWMNGTNEDRQLILEYVGQDAKATLDIVEVGTRTEILRWRSKSGKRYSLPFNPPMTVEECLSLPEKDNSWMTNPLHREDFWKWTTE